MQYLQTKWSRKNQNRTKVCTSNSTSAAIFKTI